MALVVDGEAHATKSCGSVGGNRFFFFFLGSGPWGNGSPGWKEKTAHANLTMHPYNFCAGMCRNAEDKGTPNFSYTPGMSRKTM